MSIFVLILGAIVLVTGCISAYNSFVERERFKKQVSPTTKLRMLIDLVVWCTTSVVGLAVMLISHTV